MIIIIYCAAIVLLLAFSAFFSASEITFAQANKLRIENSALEGNKNGKAADYIVKNFTRSLSTILISNNLVNTAATTLAALVGIELCERLGGSEALYDTGSSFAITLLLLIFGEIFPKILASEYCETLAYVFPRPLRLVMAVFRPVVSAVTAFVNLLSKLWTPKEQEPEITTEDLVTIVEEAEDEGVFSEKESDMIVNAISFTDTTAKEVMKPRVDVLGYDINDPIEKLLSDKDLLSYSRFPVYDETLDHVIGILSTKRLIRAYFEDKEHIDVRSLLSDPLFVHMTRTVSSILTEFREGHYQMAIVLDEFGGTYGILTAEDLVEEIVGDIFDETDEIESEVVRRGDMLEIDGMMNIDDFFDMIDCQPETESDYSTLGGWVTEQLDKLPEVGDHFDYDDGRVSLTVSEMDQMRVHKVLVHVETSDEEEEEE